MIQLNPLSLVEEVHYDRKKTNSIPLSSTFFNPELMYVPGALDRFLVGLATQPRQKVDNLLSYIIVSLMRKAHVSTL